MQIYFCNGAGFYLKVDFQPCISCVKSKASNDRNSADTDMIIVRDNSSDVRRLQLHALVSELGVFKRGSSR